MKKAVSVCTAVILTAIILLYAWVHCFDPAQGQGEEVSVDTGDPTYRGKEPYRKCGEPGFSPASTGTAEKNLPAVSMYLIQGRIGVQDFTVESLLPQRLSKAGRPVWAGDLRLEEWKQAYLSYIHSEGRYMEYCTFSLVYVDEDDIPELIIDTGSGAGGCYILTFHDHDLDVWRSDWLNVTYIERGGLVCDSGGKMGHYYDNVYAIRGGKWVFVDGGTWGDGPDGVQLDENGNIMEFFYWDDRELTREEYETRLNAIYSAGQGIFPEQYYIRDEICALLRTGDVAAAGAQIRTDCGGSAQIKTRRSIQKKVKSVSQS